MRCRCFGYLEWLSLANNYFASENDLIFLVKMTNLKQVGGVGLCVSSPHSRCSPHPRQTLLDPYTCVVLMWTVVCYNAMCVRSALVRVRAMVGPWS